MTDAKIMTSSSEAEPEKNDAAAAGEPSSEVAQETSPRAASVRLPEDDGVPSTEIDPRTSGQGGDAAASLAFERPAPSLRRVSSWRPPSVDQDATLESSVHSELSLRAALDAHLAGAEAGRPPPYVDLDGETATDLAPVGPTEFAGGGPISAGPRAGPWAGPASEAAPPMLQPGPAPSRAELERQIQELEARLDEMAGQRAARPPAPATPPKRAEPASADVHESPFVQRQWGRAALRTRAEEVEEFGHDPAVEARWMPAIDFLYRVYFRVETSGAEHVPDQGRCLVVSNHSGGTLPYDGLMLRAALRREHPCARDLRWLAEDFIYYLPFVGATMNRLGAVRACQENAERLLAKGSLVAVFPEGAKGIGKLYKERYRLQRFGRGGFIRLALRTQTPLVPCAIVGAEEANPLLFRLEGLEKSLGLPYVPITPTFPALGPLGLLPAPTKWKIELGEPISFAEYGPEAADDELLVGRLSEQVRTTIQGMLDRRISRRRSIWLG